MTDSILQQAIDRRDKAKAEQAYWERFISDCKLLSSLSPDKPEVKPEAAVFKERKKHSRYENIGAHKRAQGIKTRNAIIVLHAKGLSAKEIAIEINQSIANVNNHLSKIKTPEVVKCPPANAYGVVEQTRKINTHALRPHLYEDVSKGEDVPLPKTPEEKRLLLLNENDSHKSQKHHF